MNDVKTNEMNDLKSNRDNDTRISIDVASEDDSDFNKFQANDSNNNSSSFYKYNENCDINNDCNIELEETRSFLYCYFIINIVVNRVIKKLNLIFMKTTLLYIKEEDNNSQMLANLHVTFFFFSLV